MSRHEQKERKQRTELTEEELAEQECEPLPDREAMSVIDPTTGQMPRMPIDGDAPVWAGDPTGPPEPPPRYSE